MTGHRQLTDAEFKACLAEPMLNVTDEAEAVVDIWPYVDDLNLTALGLPHLNDVQYVYRDAAGRYDQVLIGTGRFNSLLVIVIDLQRRTIHGHHLLDLNAA